MRAPCLVWTQQSWAADVELGKRAAVTAIQSGLCLLHPCAVCLGTVGQNREARCSSCSVDGWVPYPRLQLCPAQRAVAAPMLLGPLPVAEKMKVDVPWRLWALVSPPGE